VAKEVAKELAFELFEQGKKPSDPEVKALHVKAKTTYAYYQDWKKGGVIAPSTSGVTDGSKPPTIVPPSGSKSTTTKPIEVGKITITPENWGMTQFGAILILDTYNKTKRDINYGGTIGEFLCDICEFYRRILNYKEVEYVRGTGEGRGGTEENGTESLEPAGQLLKGK